LEISTLQADRNLEGCVAIVTGGGTGIGAAVTSALGDRGASVVICHETQAVADACAQALGRPEVLAIGADLRTAEGCNQLVGLTVSKYGRVDVLVNNAGITGKPALAPFLDEPDEHLDLVIDVNLKAVFRCGRNAARWMTKTGRGVIINIASVNAFAASPDTAAYMAAKAGVVGLTKAMALELAPRGIRVIAIAPGNIDVGKPEYRSADTVQEGLAWWSAPTIPLGRRGRPADIASLAAFLCSDEASYITGQTIIVDGGMLIY
jgi:3-oxoacyl-[acyl-carrier protein] reductase